MRHSFCRFLLAAIVAAGALQRAQAQPPATTAETAATAPAAESPATVDHRLSNDSTAQQILAVLQISGQNLRDFQASVSMEEMDNLTGAIRQRSGTVWYARSDDGAVRMRLTFDKLTDDRGTVNRRIEYLLKDGWLIDRDYSSKIEVARQVLKPGETTDLLKLGEGPFPLPIGQDPAEVNKLFEVSTAPAQQDVEPDQLPQVQDTVRLVLVPRPDTQFQNDFASIDVWVNLQSRFPQRIMTSSQSSVQTTVLTELKINQSIAEDRFNLDDISADNWNRRSEPFSQ